jgi:hypothetical protein
MGGPAGLVIGLPRADDVIIHHGRPAAGVLGMVRVNRFPPDALVSLPIHSRPRRPSGLGKVRTPTSRDR